MNFNEFNFDDRLQEGLLSMGYKVPTPIQAQAIPLIAKKEDLIACAQTGTGKTASYLLPVMDAICKKEHKPIISVLILAPTRELAVQIDQQVQGLAYFTGISSIAVYGGGDGIGYEQQRRSLREGVDIVIATPGRLIAHMSSGTVKLDNIDFLILDEADRMLDMGFKDDILRIVSQLPSKRQTLLFSATMPPKIRTFAKVLLKNPQQVNIAISQPAEKIKQLYYRTFDEQKLGLLNQILSSENYASTIIFCGTKENVKLLEKDLLKKHLKVKAFHSDLSQDDREKALLDFKNRTLSMLVGTDVLSRGIDIEGIDLVVNYDVPSDPEDYIHRIGRTARAERTGTAITFVNNRDFRKLLSIERLMNRKVEECPIPEFLGESPQVIPIENKKRKKKRPNFNKKNKPAGPRAEGSRKEDKDSKAS